ncbi:hypothetical protein COCMIDRAFT_35386 [Bipolaris oryzae ATCC 44560]|uniref:Gfo/Idh/MocA-like oxidoreductase N-terminal domain-containing protein n=1 Tax=Bipolaris oryzae ATCC 44560 TaxID=930090 RepID=W6ZTP0_COCMI|nr:uncharacterized protein COCMIDRAFT_35386 [Bipolaris oryzae ATCC 44560]EUC47091.1 hypothetical protein COCMIDRAFT_35386 [Bipolaris oryzae ATCC 44560]
MRWIFAKRSHTILIVPARSHTDVIVVAVAAQDKGKAETSLKSGKHVLLEKPSVLNAQEAHSLSHHAIPQKPPCTRPTRGKPLPLPPRLSSLPPPNSTPRTSQHAEARAAVPAGFFPGHDIRFSFELAGDRCCAMHLGSLRVLSSCPQRVWQ